VFVIRICQASERRLIPALHGTPRGERKKNDVLSAAKVERNGSFFYPCCISNFLSFEKRRKKRRKKNVHCYKSFSRRITFFFIFYFLSPSPPPPSPF
jgi:hypothetical protein